MESIELYEKRAAECLRLADGTDDANARIALLAQRTAYLRVAARLRDYAAGKGFMTEAASAETTSSRG
jgi:hypothetical protein